MIEDTVQEVASEPPTTCSTSGDTRSGSIHFVLQVAGITLLLVAVIVGFARWRTGSMQLVWPYLQGQRLLFAETRIDLGTVEEKTIIEKRIRVANLSSQPVTLLGSQKSCGCISLDEFPIVIPVGGDHDLQLKIGTSDKSGPFAHTIKFFSDEPGYSSFVVAINGFVP